MHAAQGALCPGLQVLIPPGCAFRVLKQVLQIQTAPCIVEFMACRRWDADVDLSEDEELWAEMREFWSDDDADGQDNRCAIHGARPLTLIALCPPVGCLCWPGRRSHPAQENPKERCGLPFQSWACTGGSLGIWCRALQAFAHLTRLPRRNPGWCVARPGTGAARAGAPVVSALICLFSRGHWKRLRRGAGREGQRRARPPRQGSGGQGAKLRHSVVTHYNAVTQVGCRGLMRPPCELLGGRAISMSA